MSAELLLWPFQAFSRIPIGEVGRVSLIPERVENQETSW